MPLSTSTTTEIPKEFVSEIDVEPNTNFGYDLPKFTTPSNQQIYNQEAPQPEDNIDRDVKVRNNTRPSGVLYVVMIGLPAVVSESV